jgi:hypothetical protein
MLGNCGDVEAFIADRAHFHFLCSLQPDVSMRKEWAVPVSIGFHPASQIVSFVAAWTRIAAIVTFQVATAAGACKCAACHPQANIRPTGPFGGTADDFPG